ncbi:integrase catalytic domain-containing protein, partial [Nephila pilipes]
MSELHVFLDACKGDYAVCVFVKSEVGSESKVTLIRAKNREAPVKPLSIPSLELMACCIGARLVNSVIRALEARRIVSQRTPTPGVSYASKIKKTFKSCTTQTDSDLNQPNSVAICSSKSETTNSKSGVKSPRKNKHAQLREAKGHGRKKPPKIKKTEIPALDLHPTADDYTML